MEAFFSEALTLAKTLMIEIVKKYFILMDFKAPKEDLKTCGAGTRKNFRCWVTFTLNH